MTCDKLKFYKFDELKDESRCKFGERISSMDKFDE